jgi:hypothetical protein
MTDEGDVRIDKDIVDWMFENEMKENEMKESKIGFIAKFKISDKVLIHRCANNTVGLCEFIGWKKIEE